MRRQPDRPIKEIFLVSNIEEQGQAIGALGHGEISFHSDLSYLRQPGTLSLLYAIELPKSGGATHWCNGYAAYEALDEAQKMRLRGLRAVHRHYVEEQTPPSRWTTPLCASIPKAAAGPCTWGPHLTKYVVGMAADESQALLDELFAHMTQPRFIWAHHWQVGDLVMWDNRPTMHRRDPFPPAERRLLKRTQIFNDEIPVD